MASEVIEGYMRFFFIFNLEKDLGFFVKVIILSKLFMNAYIMEDTHLHANEYHLKVHEMYIRLLAKFFLTHSFNNQF